MTIKTAYTQNLDTDATIGANDYSYAIISSPLTIGGEGFKLILQGPTSGSITINDMWAGIQNSGYNFVSGSQNKITYGGQPEFTIFAGQKITTDLVIMPTIIGNRLLVIYDALGGSGKAYRRKIVSGMSYGYSAGQKNDANGEDTRSFTNLPNYTALVSSILVGSVSDFDEIPQPDPEQIISPYYPWFDSIKSDQLYSNGNFFVGTPGKSLAVGLFNPENSGRELYLHQIDINADEDTRITIHSASINDWPINGSRCNLDFRTGSPASISKLHYSSLAVIPDGVHGFKKFKGNLKEI